MIRILILTLIILNNCGKKGDLYLDGRESNTIIEFEEDLKNYTYIKKCP